MAESIQYEIPTWNQIYEMLLAQAQKIQTSNFHPDIIIGIARGGLIPSRILADLLETHDFAVITIEYYVRHRQNLPRTSFKTMPHANTYRQKGSVGR